MYSAWQQQLETMGVAAWSSRSIRPAAGPIGAAGGAGAAGDVEHNELDEFPTALCKKLTTSTFCVSDLDTEGEDSEESEADEVPEAVEALSLMGNPWPQDSDELVAEACPSIGSVSHFVGSCKPCGFFWKASGCGHGRECQYCHLCPEGELKARKKERRTKAIFDAYQQLDPWAAPASGEPQKVTILSGSYIESLPEPALGSFSHLASFLPETAASVPPPPPVLAAQEQPLAAAAQAPGGAMAGADAAAAAVPSVGSALHASGRCKPCIWFWKPQGCENGRDCLHCHLCSSREAKQRKLLARTRKSEGADVAASKRPVAVAAGAKQQGRVLPICPEAAVAQPSQQVPPSLGSMLHGTGRCKPCRWFWRPQGCDNGQDCQHCHLCPCNEAKERKRLKRAILRRDDLTQAVSREEALTMAAAWLPPPPGL